ncbi:MAG: type II toxin-antitoxin system PemK/MazF family toxin [Anaerostipes sp.]|jgi:mRNA interferase MazF
MKINRGEIWLVDFGPQMDANDHLQHGIRPAIIVSNNKANENSPVIHVVPLTSKIGKKRFLPTHIFINGYEASGIERHSIAECEQLQAINYGNLIECKGKISPFQTIKVGLGIQIQLALNMQTSEK